MSMPQWLYEDTGPQKVTIATAKAVDRGDLVGLNANTLVRAEDTAWNVDLATTQTDFANMFAGVSEQTKDNVKARCFGNSEDNVCVVATRGVYEYDCDAATFEIGDYVGPAKDVGNALLSDKVVKVASEALAVGRVVERGTNITRVKFRVLSKLLNSGRFA